LKKYGKTAVLKSLEGNKWSSPVSITLHTNHIYNLCTTYVQPILQYGSEAKITTTPATFNKLEVIQNLVQRLITGAVTPSPLTTMPVLTTNKCLKTQKKITLILHKKLACLT
jgi:hypothetical protein